MKFYFILDSYFSPCVHICIPICNFTLHSLDCYEVCFVNSCKVIFIPVRLVADLMGLLLLRKDPPP